MKEAAPSVAHSLRRGSSRRRDVVRAVTFGEPLLVRLDPSARGRGSALVTPRWLLISGIFALGPTYCGYSSQETEEIVENFEEKGGILVSTDAMNEGRNLQFCNLVVNYDLAWNPMKVEQRIGRIHRIGQKRDVYIFNMALKDTIEEYVLERLYQKIDLFQQTVGELSAVLTRLEESGTNFEDEIFERLGNADSEIDLENDFDAMAVDIQEQRDLAEKLEGFNSGVFEGFDLGASDD